MAGSEVFKLAVTLLGRVVDETLAANKLDKSAIDWLVPHQANLRIIQAVAKKLDLPMERVIVTVQEHGNTSTASVPLALDIGVRDGRIKRGDLLLLEALGGGVTWGSALLRLAVFGRPWRLTHHARQQPAARQSQLRGWPWQKKRRGNRGVFLQAAGSNYFETDFLNMRSIFSLVASHRGLRSLGRRQRLVGRALRTAGSLRSLVGRTLRSAGRARSSIRRRLRRIHLSLQLADLLLQAVDSACSGLRSVQPASPRPQRRPPASQRLSCSF